jgi:hypothetical protein
MTDQKPSKPKHPPFPPKNELFDKVCERIGGIRPKSGKSDFVCETLQEIVKLCDSDTDNENL